VAREYRLQGGTAEHRYFNGTRTLVDPDTGEILTAGPAETHRIVSIAQSDAYHEREEFRGRQTDFTFNAMEMLHEVTSVLTKAQCGFLLVLQCHIGYNSVLINANKTPMKPADMQRTLKLRKNTFYDFFRKCVKHRFIIENDNGTYAVNDAYHFRGTVPTGVNVVKTYSTKIKRLYGEMKPEDLGLLYRMLPLVHYGTNALCTNHGERMPEAIDFLNRAQLAEAIGISTGEISRRLPKMIVDGEYVIAKVTIGDTDMYMFNPWIFYRKMTEPDDTMRAIFSVKPTR
jgi:hypothetical protein